MRASGAECKGVPPFPKDVASEEHYRKLFNREAKKLGYPITWTLDHQKGLPNIPEMKLGEIQVESGKTFQLTNDVICKIRSVIEGKRKKAASETRLQMRIDPSKTQSLEIMSIANPAEQRWLKVVSDDLQAISLDIYGRQESYRYRDLKNWMSQHGDVDSRWHFNRMRTIPFPKAHEPAASNLTKAFGIQDGSNEKIEDYASNFPWFPEKARFNAMLPSDMTKEDKEYLSQQYDKDHPIRLPWTVVENISAAEQYDIDVKRSSGEWKSDANTMPLISHAGKPSSWLVKGRNDRWYKVTNMAFHPDYQPHFQRIAEVLRKASELPPLQSGGQGHDLSPEFKAYTRVMADSLERGEFLKLLQADLAQKEGNLFMTFFPHEGYWADGIKFPLMLDIGIRDTASGKLSLKEGGIFQELEDRTASLASAANLLYQARKIDPKEAAGSAVLAWMYRTGGFLRAFYREPAGHDYPKREYDGIKGHRNVILLDSSVVYRPEIDRLLQALIDPSGKIKTEDQDTIDFITWHEGTHGVGARPDNPTKSGRTMSDVYGSYWGAIAEPLADAGSVLALQFRYEKGLLNKKEWKRKIGAIIGFQLKRVQPKKVAAGPYLGHPEAGHFVGATAIIGLLFKQGALRLRADQKTAKIDESKFIKVSEYLYEKLTHFSLTDDVEGLKAFLTDAIHSIPDTYEKAIQAAQAKYTRPNLVNRNPDQAEFMTVIK